MTVPPLGLPASVAWWLGSDVPTPNRAIVEQAVTFGVGLIEVPPGSNRGPEIDLLCRNAGLPVGQYWCAMWAGEIWRRAALEIPKGYPSCDRWLAWATETRRFTRHTAAPGCAVLYGVPGDARHIGIVIRTRDCQALGAKGRALGLSLEGNTTVEGSKFERNGTAVALKIVDPDVDPVLGFVHPLPLS